MKLLIVEDSMLYQKAIVKHMKEHFPEAEYFVASNGREGLEFFQEKNPDFILFDLLMPEMNGQEMLKKIKDLDPSAKAIVISADVQKIIKDEVESVGVLRFVNKPFTPDKAAEVAALIRES